MKGFSSWLVNKGSLLFYSKYQWFAKDKSRLILAKKMPLRNASDHYNRRCHIVMLMTDACTSTIRCLEDFRRNCDCHRDLSFQRRQQTHSVQHSSSVNKDTMYGGKREKGKEKAPAIHRHREVKRAECEGKSIKAMEKDRKI